MKFKLDENLGTRTQKHFAILGMTRKRFMKKVCKEVPTNTSTMPADKNSGV